MAYQQPLFFKSPVAIQAEAHANAGISSAVNFKFAKLSNSVPINIQEFGYVCKNYPIVFTSDASCVPVAVLGLENSVNVFVNDKGDWEKGTYIPAYVRRYPFAFTSSAEGNLVLCVDESADRFKKNASSGDMLFFNNGEQTEFIKSVLNYCAEFHRDQHASQQFGQELNNRGLLIEKQISANVEGRTAPISLSGFKMVDEEKLNQLDNDTILKWHKNGYLSLIYFHLLSGSNWQQLSLRTK